MIALILRISSCRVASVFFASRSRCLALRIAMFTSFILAETAVELSGSMHTAWDIGGELLRPAVECRLGCAAPRTLAAGSQWATFTGNQIGALLTDFVLEHTADLTPEHYLVKTLVTTEMIRRIGDSYGVRTYGDLLVGFKWIGGVMD